MIKLKCWLCNYNYISQAIIIVFIIIIIARYCSRGLSVKTAFKSF